MNPFRTWFLMALPLLAVPLMGVNTEEAFGCSCGASGGASPSIAGGGVASSPTYDIGRSGIGTSFEEMASSNKTYEANATLGNYLTLGRTQSNHYLIRHPMTRRVVTK